MKRNRHGKAAIFKPHEIKKIRQVFTVSYHRAIFEIALFTGERMGAILQLQVSDVFDVRGRVREVVTFAARTRKGQEGKRQTRQVAIHPELRAFLESYQVPERTAHDFEATSKSVSSSIYLFPSPLTPDRPIRYDSVYQYWQSKFIELGLDHRGFSCHSTRRWFITQLVKNGTDLKTVQQITGHRSTQVLLGYVEADEKRTRGAIAAISV